MLEYRQPQGWPPCAHRARRQRACVMRLGRERGRIAPPCRVSRAGRPLRWHAAIAATRPHRRSAVCASQERRKAVVARSGDRMMPRPDAASGRDAASRRVAAHSPAGKPPPGEGLPLPNGFSTESCPCPCPAPPSACCQASSPAWRFRLPPPRCAARRL